MYAHITTVTLAPGTTKTDLLHLHDRMLAVLKTLPGFVRYYGMIDRKAATAVAITYWQTEGDLDQSSNELERLRAGIFTDLGVLDHSFAEYEVAHHF